MSMLHPGFLHEAMHATDARGGRTLFRKSFRQVLVAGASVTWRTDIKASTQQNFMLPPDNQADDHPTPATAIQDYRPCTGERTAKQSQHGDYGRY